jgi:Fic/DOC family
MPPLRNPQIAAALERVHQSASDGIVQTDSIARRDRELLISAGWLLEILRGWYLLITPNTKKGDTVIWHSSFWAFAAAYLESRFAKRYVLSPEASLDLHTGITGTPKQLTVLTASGGNTKIDLPIGSSIFMHANPDTLPAAKEIVNGVQVMPLGLALVRTTPTFFRLAPLTAEIALKRVRREELSRALLTEWNAASAGRLLGGLAAIGRASDFANVAADIAATGYRAEPINPFERPPLLNADTKFDWPHAARVTAMWTLMRANVLAHRPPPPAALPPLDHYMGQARANYVRDAYNSLSIEGYQVTPELIARVASGAWDASQAEDRKQVDAMAARGYFEAHQKVLEAITQVFAGKGAGKIFEDSLNDWYRALFSASVQAGILEPWQLAGYRERAVYINGASHVPPPKDAVPACMETLFELLRNEPDAWVRAVLGHFTFVFIHPYSDGNGRLGRFLLNLMLASGGYPWTVIEVERRSGYMAALESASAQQDIEPFARFVADEMPS